MTPQVSIVILNYNHPEVIDICLRTLQITTGVPYEVVVVDNGSKDGVAQLQQHRAEGRIDTLVLEPKNNFFSEGNNIGVRSSHPDSKYVLLLNSDVAFLRPDWLTKTIAWMEGTIEHWPSVWGLKPATPTPGPKDIVSVGWSHDATVLPGHTRPEGWCCLMRKGVYKDMSPDLPWHGGFEEMIANAVRGGAKCGVLCMYGSYLVHREGGSGKAADGTIRETRPMDVATWFDGLFIETLDFALGPDEHSSYLNW